MAVYIALLRAVNVGGTGKLPMSELRAMCERAGFDRVRTYIASGNVVFASGEDRASVTAKLETALREYAGKPVGVHVRTAEELTAVLAANPFPEAPGNRVLTTFLDTAPAADLCDHASGRQDERIELGNREVFVHYASGMGRSKLKIPGLETGTARNMNTVAKLVAMACEDA